VADGDEGAAESPARKGTVNGTKTGSHVLGIPVLMYRIVLTSYFISCESSSVDMVKLKKVENPSVETRALRMVARADRLKDIILDELYGLHYSGLNISVAQVQEIAARIMRRADLPTGEEARKAEDYLRRALEQKFLKRQNGKP